MKTMKKLIVATIIAMMAIGFNVVPAHAYTELLTPVTISATGTLTGTIATYSVDVVTQATGAASSLVFESPAGITDSGEALKIQGGTNEIDAKIIIYTDNDSNTAPHEVPTVDANTGIDGSGLVGQTNTAYSVALMWGVNSSADYAPNTNTDYTFDGNMDDGVKEVYIVDKRHTVSFCDEGIALDNNPLYEDLAGTIPSTPVNVANDGLYPQSWLTDYYDPSLTDLPGTPEDERLVSQALYKNIATLAFSIGIGAEGDSAYYTCRVPNLTTIAADDNVLAKLRKVDDTVGDSLYVYIGGDFRGKPAQTYSTGQLNVALIKE